MNAQKSLMATKFIATFLALTLIMKKFKFLALSPIKGISYVNTSMSVFEKKNTFSNRKQIHTVFKFDI